MLVWRKGNINRTVSSDFMVLCKCLKIILTSLYLVDGLAWWDWPLTWWTDQLLSFSALTLLVGSSDPWQSSPKDFKSHLFGLSLAFILIVTIVYFDYVQRSCSSLYRLLRFINSPAYITIVPDMTYNVFGGTLNPTLLLYRVLLWFE